MSSSFFDDSSILLEGTPDKYRTWRSNKKTKDDDDDDDDDDEEIKSSSFVLSPRVRIEESEDDDEKENRSYEDSPIVMRSTKKKTTTTNRAVFYSDDSGDDEIVNKPNVLREEEDDSSDEEDDVDDSQEEENDSNDGLDRVDESESDDESNDKSDRESDDSEVECLNETLNKVELKETSDDESNSQSDDESNDSEVEMFNKSELKDKVDSSVNEKPTKNNNDILKSTITPPKSIEPAMDKQDSKSHSSLEKKSPPKPAIEVIDLVDDHEEEENRKKVYTEAEVLNLEAEVKKKENLIEKNNKLLKFQGRLPNNGAKLKSFIEELRKSHNELLSELEHARKNKISSSSFSSSNGSVVVNEEQKIDLLRKKLSVLRQQYSVIRPEQLADGGATLRSQIAKTQLELAELQKDRPYTASGPQNTKSAWQEMRERGLDFVSSNFGAQGPAENQLYGGRMNQARKLEVVSVTQEAIKKLHDSLATMPVETDEEEDPACLKSKYNLFPHQRQGLAWLLWRETQQPPGGILADDMGLGKTLTMISLVAKSKELMEGKEDSDWIDSKPVKGLVRSKGTLIICPASLLGQWEGEASKRIKSGALKVLVYHGTNRGKSASGLARYDLVITTYNTVMHEIKGASSEKNKESKTKLEELKAVDLDGVEAPRHVQLLNVAWERIILDEAHQIRNPRSQTALAVCRLRAARRWCVTGTPIQNKELDMYSLIRFLRCSPFDEYRVWKLWVDNKTSQGQMRMNTLVKSLMLRRTKEQKSTVTGNSIVTLPPKSVIEHKISLQDEEQKVYDHVFSLSRNAMINYMKKYDDDNDENDDRNKYTPNLVSARAGYEPENKDVKAHHLLVLLLRLRQICCHPGLIQSMLDNESRSTEGIEDDDGEDLDLISRLADMSLARSDTKKVLQEEDDEPNLLATSNPVFRDDTPSSKILKVMEALKKLKKDSNGGYEKAVIVSQWTSMLEIIKSYVQDLGMNVVSINGQVPVKSRGEIVASFNRKGSGPRVMLLSLGAGGVGLNLVGANHLFLLDMHWNPQLEQQACDRIYRVGQERNVFIHKFLCEDTVESRILLLQQRKLQLADGVLTGAKRSGASKLTFEDLKMLFNVS